jgi:hypothetical protein
MSRQDVVNTVKRWADDSSGEAHVELTPTEAPPVVEPERRRLLDGCAAVITKWWPELWPAVDATMSAITTLRLRDVDVGIPFILMGSSGTGKSRVCDFVGPELTNVVVWRDSFTTASLQGHAQTVAKEELQKRSLIAVCKDKALIVPELAWMKTGTQVHQAERYAQLLQWMDGKGRISDSSIHGAIGDHGLYPTVLVGGTTTLKTPTWELMGQLGPRMLMYLLERHPERVRVREHLVSTAKNECKEAVQEVLQATFKGATTRDIPPSSWPSVSDECDELLGRYSSITALSQAFKEHGDHEYEFPTANQFRTRLTLVVIGRAVLYGRSAVDASDMEMARWIARSSTPQSRGAVLLELFEGATTSLEIQHRARLSQPTVDGTLEELKTRYAVVECVVADNAKRGRPSQQWRIRADAWDRV